MRPTTTREWRYKIFFSLRGGDHSNLSSKTYIHHMLEIGTNYKCIFDGEKKKFKIYYIQFKELFF